MTRAVPSDFVTAIEYLGLEEAVDRAFDIAFETGKAGVYEFALVECVGGIMICAERGPMLSITMTNVNGAKRFRNSFWENHTRITGD